MSESAWGEGSAAAAIDDVDESWPHDEEQPAASAEPSSFPLYPVALKLAGRLAVVVGGGAIAQRKTADLLRAGARVWAIAPEWRADFSGLEADPDAGGRLLRITRGFTAGDLVGAFLVVAATDDVVTQRAVARAAESQGVLCNVVDVNDLCSFYVPATLRRGALAIAVQTDGRFPLLAVALRDRLARLIGPGFAPALDRLAEARADVRRRFPEDAGRRVQELRALFGDEALDLLLGERLDEFETRVDAWRKGLAS
jgi:precorrin-2 dehydrogenase/sirohydrochlorin ferrochelatase